MLILEIILKLMPLIITIIQTIDQAIPEKGNGAIKAEVVTGMVEKALTADPTIPNELIPEVMVAISEQTKDLVTAFKDTGVFKAGVKP